MEKVSMPKNSHLPDQPIMKYAHPVDRWRPWFGLAVGLAQDALAGDLKELCEAHNVSGDGTLVVPSDYLEAVAVRG